MFEKIKEAFKQFVDKVKYAFKKAFGGEKTTEKEIEGYDIIFIKAGKQIEKIKTNDEITKQLKNYDILLKYLTAYQVETVYQLNEKKIYIYIKSVKNDIKEVNEE